MVEDRAGNDRGFVAVSAEQLVLKLIEHKTGEDLPTEEERPWIPLDDPLAEEYRVFISPIQPPNYRHLDIYPYLEVIDDTIPRLRMLSLVELEEVEGKRQVRLTATGKVFASMMSLPLAIEQHLQELAAKKTSE